MGGSILAVLSALSFAVNSILLRRAVLKISDASLGVMISIPIGVPFALFLLIFTGRLGSLADLSWQSVLFFAAAGISHYCLGRSFNYNSIQLVGSNITSILRRSSILVAVSLGLFLLNEPVGWKVVVGVLFIIFGITITGLNPKMFDKGARLFSDMPRKALFYGFGTGFFWGISPILIKLGILSGGPPMAGVLVSFLTATLVMALSLFHRQRREELWSMPGKAVLLFAGAGLLSSAANLARFFALSVAPASIVAPLVATAPVFVLILAFLFNRKLEVFSMNVIIGCVTTVMGGILLI
ncbi:MAG: EamA family transporter [Desulfobacterales bacterium]|nr:EamA family transporter [Desulfobacterales bacterium]